MSKVIVLGGGGQVGGVAVRTLAASDEIDEVVIGDFNVNKANALAADIGMDKVSVIKVDANDPATIRTAVEGLRHRGQLCGSFFIKR